MQEQKYYDLKSIIFDKATILVCDDNQSNRKLIIDILDHSPLKTYEAINGKEAVELAEQIIPDLILMDLRMPEMDGYTATRILRNREKTKSIPVIAISASSQIVLKSGDLKDIFVDFLLKPIIIEDFIETLKKYLNYTIIKKPALKAEESEKIDFTDEHLKLLPELLSILENDLLPKFKEAQKSNLIDEIEDFGKELISIGDKYSVVILSDLGNKIYQSSQSFEIDKLTNSLSQFPELIEKIKSLIVGK